MMSADQASAGTAQDAAAACVMLFSRYPEPGRAKTRLIPRLGAGGAAALHRRLTERALATVRASGLRFVLQGTGAPLSAFRAWLGDGVPLADQGEGDLGARLARAAAAPPVLLIGADAPDLAAGHLQAAAAALATHDAVLGPAEDGGYWLLGLAAPMPFLFDGVAWGTDAVCEMTRRRLAARGRRWVELETLADLDRPEDLASWPALTRLAP